MSVKVLPRLPREDKPEAKGDPRLNQRFKGRVLVVMQSGFQFDP